MSKSSKISSNDLLQDNLTFAIEKHTYSKSVTMPYSHYHSHYEILYFTSGKRKLIVNDTTEYILDQEHIAVISPYIIHKTEPIDTNTQSRILVNVSQEFIDNVAMLFSSQLFSCFNYPVIELDNYTKAVINKELMRLYENSISKSPNNDIRYLGLINIASELSSHIANSQQHSFVNTSGMNRIHDITKYIESHISDELTLTFLSQKFHITPEYLSRSFKASTGITLIKYITNMRLLIAKRYLRNKTISIEDVANYAGFASVNHFDKVFKKNVGCSPKHFQKQLLNDIC